MVVVVDEEVAAVEEEGDEVAVVVEEEAEVAAVVVEWEVVAVVVKEDVVAEVLVVAVAHCVVLQPNVLSRSLPPASYAWGLLVCSCVCSSRV